MALRKKEGCKILSETRPGENEPADVSVRASIWNYKTSDGGYLFPAERNTKSGWRVCALLSGV